MSHEIKRISYVGDYKLQLTFENRVIKIVNFEKLINKAWENRKNDPENLVIPLHDTNYFQKVACDGDTISWPNGLCLCPDALYQE